MARQVRAPVSSDVLAAIFDDALTSALADLPRRFASQSRHLISAVSGGPDSMALAQLAKAYAARHGAAHRALVVDHGLRPGSAEEAGRVAARLRAFGITADVLEVTAQPASTGIQEWARARRYDLLLREARRTGGCLLLGHHAADQAETVMMRLARGSGLAGLAGMRQATFREGVAILRPLLAADRAAILDYCDDEGLVFERDPSNADSRFERVRCRRALAAMDRSGLAGSSGLLRLSRAAAGIDSALLDGLARAGLLTSLSAAGHMTLRAAALRLPQPAMMRLLARVIRLVAAPRHGPGQEALERLGTRLRDDRPATLGGVRFTLTGEEWLVTAEIGRRPPRCHVAAGQTVLFAGNWLVSSPVDAMVRYLGEAGSGPRAGWRDSAGWSGVPSLVRRSLPVLETLDGGLLYPHLITQGRDVRADFMATAECLRYGSALPGKTS